jgi:hypothetical protein
MLGVVFDNKIKSLKTYEHGDSEKALGRDDLKGQGVVASAWNL